MPDDQLHRYLPTIALTDILFTSEYYQAIGYPSLATERKGINVVMEPNTAVAKLTPFEAWEFEMGPDSMRIPEAPEMVPVHAVRRTASITDDGTFVWLPRGVDLDADALEGLSHRAAAAIAKNQASIV